MGRTTLLGAGHAAFSIESALRAAGLWSRFDVIQPYALGANSTDALKNLISASFTATAPNSPTWTAGRGFQGNGTNSYVNTQFPPASAVVATQNRQTLFIWNNDLIAAGTYLAGASGSGGTGFEAILGRLDDTTLYADLNRAASPTSFATAVGDQYGLLAVSRVDASTVRAYQRGYPLGSAASTSIALDTDKIYIGARNPNSGGNPANLNTASIGLFAFGDLFTDAEHLTIAGIFGRAMRAVGNFKRPVEAWGDSLTDGATQTNFPTQLAALRGGPVFNGGVSGDTSTQIKVRMLAGHTPPGEIVVIWAGRNNFAALSTVLSDVAAMAAASPSGRYVVLGVTNGNSAAEYLGGANYQSFIDLNNALAAAHPNNFIDIRTILVNSYNPGVPQDVIDFANDIPPSTLRINAIHFNTAGYAIVAAQLHAFMNAKGW